MQLHISYNTIRNVTNLMFVCALTGETAAVIHPGVCWKTSRGSFSVSIIE